MSNNVTCYVKPSATLLKYPEFWRKECNLHLGRVLKSKDTIVLTPENIKAVKLIKKSALVLADTLYITSDHGVNYIVICTDKQAEWFDVFVRKFVEEFEKGGNDFIYYRNEEYNVCHMRRIVAAAMRVDGTVVLGARHGSTLMCEALDRLFKGDRELEIKAMNRERIDGFIDQYDVFWDREQALTIAICSEQLRKRTSSRTELFSEDVW